MDARPGKTCLKRAVFESILKGGSFAATPYEREGAPRIPGEAERRVLERSLFDSDLWWSAPEGAAQCAWIPPNIMYNRLKYLHRHSGTPRRMNDSNPDDQASDSPWRYEYTAPPSSGACAGYFHARGTCHVVLKLLLLDRLGRMRYKQCRSMNACEGRVGSVGSSHCRCFRSDCPSKGYSPAPQSLDCRFIRSVVFFWQQQQ